MLLLYEFCARSGEDRAWAGGRPAKAGRFAPPCADGVCRLGLAARSLCAGSADRFLSFDRPALSSARSIAFSRSVFFGPLLCPLLSAACVPPPFALRLLSSPLLLFAVLLLPSSFSLHLLLAFLFPDHHRHAVRSAHRRQPRSPASWRANSSDLPREIGEHPAAPRLRASFVPRPLAAASISDQHRGELRRQIPESRSAAASQTNRFARPSDLLVLTVGACPA